MNDILQTWSNVLNIKFTFIKQNLNKKYKLNDSYFLYESYGINYGYGSKLFNDKHLIIKNKLYYKSTSKLFFESPVYILNSNKKLLIKKHKYININIFNKNNKIYYNKNNIIMFYSFSVEKINTKNKSIKNNKTLLVFLCKLGI